MAKAKKLKSGSWRCLVYSHTQKKKNEMKKIKNTSPNEFMNLLPLIQKKKPNSWHLIFHL